MKSLSHPSTISILNLVTCLLVVTFGVVKGGDEVVSNGDLSATQAAESTVATTVSGDLLQGFYFQEIASILGRHCSGCHGEEKQKAGLRVDRLNPSMALDHEVESWAAIRDVLNAHEMPPEDESQLSEPERQQLVDWIDASFEQVAERRRANSLSATRRLTVFEYENTLQELFGSSVTFAKNLPAAPLSEYGYSRDAALLRVSALELEYFLSIARQSVEDFVIFGEHIPDSEHFLIEFEDVEYRPGVAGGYTVDEPLNADELLEKRRARAAGEHVYSDRSLFPLPEGPLDLRSEELNRADRQKFHQQFARFKSRDLHKAGELIARVHVAAKLGKDGSAPRLRFRIGDTSGIEFGEDVKGDRDVTASITEPQICTFRIPFRRIPGEDMEEGKETRLTLHISNVSHDSSAIFDVVPEGYNYSPKRRGLMARYRKTLADAIVSKAKMRDAGVNELYLDAVEIDIVPFGLDTSAKLWRIDAQRAGLNAGADSRAVAEESLHAFRGDRGRVSTFDK